MNRWTKDGITYKIEFFNYESVAIFLNEKWGFAWADGKTVGNETDWISGTNAGHLYELLAYAKRTSWHVRFTAGSTLNDVVGT